MKKVWEKRRSTKIRRSQESLLPINETIKVNKDNADKLLDEDLTIVKHTIEKQESKQFLDPMTIKTLSSEALVRFIAEQQSQLKQLKIELLTRIV